MLTRRPSDVGGEAVRGRLEKSVARAQCALNSINCELKAQETPEMVPWNQELRNSVILLID